MASSERAKEVVSLSADHAIDCWQTEHIVEGLRQAEAGEFASDDEVAEVFARWQDGC